MTIDYYCSDLEEGLNPVFELFVMIDLVSFGMVYVVMMKWVTFFDKDEVWIVTFG